MGVAGDDYNGDGRGDLYVTNLAGQAPALFVNRTRQGAPTFTDGLPVRRRGAERSRSGWGTAFVDLDLDTDLDLLVANGAIPVVDLGLDAQPLGAYGNLAAAGPRAASRTSAPPSASRGSARSTPGDWQRRTSTTTVTWTWPSTSSAPLGPAREPGCGRELARGRQRRVLAGRGGGGAPGRRPPVPTRAPRREQLLVVRGPPCPLRARPGDPRGRGPGAVAGRRSTVVEDVAVNQILTICGGGR